MAEQISKQIKVALIELTERMNGPDTARLVASMERLDALAAEGRGVLDPRLLHFLERRSYAKALDFLAGDSAIPSGTCGPKPS